MIKVKKTCPLGSTCEEIKDGEIQRCTWYTKVVGKHPQSNEHVDQWDCAIAWLPMLSIEMSQTNRGQTQALCDLRDQVKQSNNNLKQSLQNMAVIPLKPVNQTQVIEG